MAEKNFKKLEDLKPVVAIVNEAEALLEDKNRTFVFITLTFLRSTSLPKNDI